MTALALLYLLVPPVDLRLPEGPGPVTNPYKGYAPWVQPGGLKDVPSTMVYYGVSWRELEPKEGEYRFAEWEAKTLKATPGKRVVLRVYMDYPHSAPGVPQWLLDQGVKMTSYSDYGGGKSPDYADPRLRNALKKLILAMGARWNKDQQVAYVQLGILGHWGEWHTYPRPELFASDEVQAEVVDTLRAAFPDKKLMGRNAVGYVGKQAWLGFHDDMIPSDTLGPEDWAFWPTIKTAGRDANWKVAPTGGEMVPGAAIQYLGKDWDLTLRAVKEAHLSWLGPYCPLLENSQDPTYQKRAAELSQKLGYEFRLSRVVAIGLDVRLEGVNQGVAPFYYPWPARFALLDGKGKVVSTTDAPSDVRKWLPGPFSLSTSLKKPAKPGSYRLAFGLIDPWSGRPAVQFANQLPEIDGWTVLTPISVK